MISARDKLIELFVITVKAELVQPIFELSQITVSKILLTLEFLITLCLTLKYHQLFMHSLLLVRKKRRR